MVEQANCLQSYLGAGIELSPFLLKRDINPYSGKFKFITWDDHKDVILATTTSYKNMENPSDKLRAGLALQMIRTAMGNGYNVVVVDAGSDAGWKNCVKAIDGVTLVDENLTNYVGQNFMGKSRRQSLDVAVNKGNHKVIVWIEPEKYPMICNESNSRSPLARFVSPIYYGIADIVIPRRIDSLQSYPLQQQMEELTGNLTLFDMVRSYVQEKVNVESANNVPYLDYWVGPRAISRDSIDAFLKYTGMVSNQQHDRWESIFNPVVSEMLSGKVVRGVPVHYIHPPEQSQLEASDPSFSAKRVDQLVSIVAGVKNLLLGYKGDVVIR